MPLYILIFNLQKKYIIWCFAPPKIKI